MCACIFVVCANAYAYVTALIDRVGFMVRW